MSTCNRWDMCDDERAGRDEHYRRDEQCRNPLCGGVIEFRRCPYCHGSIGECPTCGRVEYSECGCDGEEQ